MSHTKKIKGLRSGERGDCTFKCHIQKTLKDWGSANVGAAPLKLFADIYWYELPSFLLEWSTEVSRSSLDTFYTYYPLFPRNGRNRATDQSPKIPQDTLRLTPISNTPQSLKYARSLFLEQKEVSFQTNTNITINVLLRCHVGESIHK